jgi:3-isopropylmalate/(R)-2-methylmalate dehydratase small subunit
MRRVRIVQGRVLPLPVADVDTDQIIAAKHLVGTTREGLGRHAFGAWRGRAGFPLDDPRHAGATVLATGPNFGCGSSREHAVWALADLGIEAVIAPSLADIFRSNCLNNGIVPVVLAKPAVDAIVAHACARPDDPITIDVERTRVECGVVVCSFPLEPHARMRLLEGLDAIGVTLRHDADIAAFERARARSLPTTSEGGVP